MYAPPLQKRGWARGGGARGGVAAVGWVGRACWASAGRAVAAAEAAAARGPPGWFGRGAGWQWGGVAVAAAGPWDSSSTRTQMKMLREILDDSIDSDMPSGASTG
jgi:hypothetical protein